MRKQRPDCEGAHHRDLALVRNALPQPRPPRSSRTTTTTTAVLHYSPTSSPPAPRAVAGAVCYLHRHHHHRHHHHDHDHHHDHTTMFIEPHAEISAPSSQPVLHPNPTSSAPRAVAGTVCSARIDPLCSDSCSDEDLASRCGRRPLARPQQTPTQCCCVLPVGHHDVLPLRGR